MAKEDKKVCLSGNAVPDWYTVLEPEIIARIAQKEDADLHIKALQTTLNEMMKMNGVDKITTDLTSASHIKASECRRFDTERFKKENEELYSRYCKIVNRSETVALRSFEPEDD